MRFEYIQGQLAGEERVLISRDAEGMAAIGSTYPLGAMIFLERGDTSISSLKSIRGTSALSRSLNQLIMTRSANGLKMIKPLERLLRSELVFTLSVGNADTENALNVLTAKLLELDG